MLIADIVILLIIALFVWKGVRMGLIESFGGIIGVFAGAFFAGRYYELGADLIARFLFGSQSLAKILAFVLIFIIINRACALIFHLVGQVFNVIAIIPFLKTFNRLLGGILGLVEGLIFVGVLVLFLNSIPLTIGIQEKVSKSKFNSSLKVVGKIAIPLLPDSILHPELQLPKFPIPQINIPIK